MGGQAEAESINNTRDARPQLPTSRAASHRERAVLAILRAKAPRRALDLREAAQVAEWQATTLLELAALTEPPTPASLIAQLPRVLVQSDVDLPVFSCTSWQSGRWLIILNAAEPLVRQRFSLAHEFKHVIDHRFRQQRISELSRLFRVSPQAMAPRADRLPQRAGGRDGYEARAVVLDEERHRWCARRLRRTPPATTR